MTSVKYPSFQEFRQESKLTQVAKRDYPIIDASGLPCITKINHMVHGLEKSLPIIRYADKTFFERQYRRISQLMRLPVQVTIVKGPTEFLRSQL
jgi:hypothetical protein